MHTYTFRLLSYRITSLVAFYFNQACMHYWKAAVKSLDKRLVYFRVSKADKTYFIWERLCIAQLRDQSRISQFSQKVFFWFKNSFNTFCEELSVNTKYANTQQ